MRLNLDSLLERARRCDEEQSATAVAMCALARLPHSSWRAWLREHPVYATAAMVTALATAARHATENALSILDDAEEIAILTCDQTKESEGVLA